MFTINENPQSQNLFQNIKNPKAVSFRKRKNETFSLSQIIVLLLFFFLLPFLPRQKFQRSQYAFAKHFDVSEPEVFSVEK